MRSQTQNGRRVRGVGVRVSVGKFALDENHFLSERQVIDSFLVLVVSVKCTLVD